MKFVQTFLLLGSLAAVVAVPAAGQTVIESGEFSLRFDGDLWYASTIEPGPDGTDWSNFFIDSGLDSTMSNGQLLSDAFLTTFGGYNCCKFRLDFSYGGIAGSNPALASLEIDDDALTAAVNAKLGLLTEMRLELIETPASGPENIPLTLGLADFSLRAADFGSGVVMVFEWDWDLDDSFIENNSTYRFRITASERCSTGTTNAGNGVLIDSLYLNGSNGGIDRTVEAAFGEFLTVTVLKPIAGGNGRFVVHANTGDASASVLPFGIGAFCFPLLTGNGAAPVIVANNIGRTAEVGESNYFGTPIEDPDLAMTEFFFPAFPSGTVLTFQGVIVDPASAGSKAASTTNAVTLRVQ